MAINGKVRGTVYFLDGHTEDIFFLEEVSVEHIRFETPSGRYVGVVVFDPIPYNSDQLYVYGEVQFRQIIETGINPLTGTVQKTAISAPIEKVEWQN